MTGRLDVWNIAHSLTAKQFLGWERYFKVEPPPESKLEWYAAQIAMMVFNMAVQPEHRRELKEFILEWRDPDEPPKPKPPQTFEEQIAIAHLWAESQAALIRERSPDR